MLAVLCHCNFCNQSNMIILCTDSLLHTLNMVCPFRIQRLCTVGWATLTLWMTMNKIEKIVSYILAIYSYWPRFVKKYWVGKPKFLREKCGENLKIHGHSSIFFGGGSARASPNVYAYVLSYHVVPTSMACTAIDENVAIILTMPYFLHCTFFGISHEMFARREEIKI